MTLLQSNHYLGSLKRPVVWILKIAITSACLWLIVQKIDVREFSSRADLVNAETIGVIFLIIMLMLINWWLEAEKWRISLQDEVLSFSQAAAAVLRGLALNWVIPFTLGDAAGRLAGVQHRKQALWAIAVNRVIMLLITLLYGALAVLFYCGWLNSISFLSVILAGVFLYALLTQNKSLGTMPRKTVGKLIYLSITRYLVFTLQFFIIISFFNPTLSVVVITMGIGWIFFFRSMLPSLLGNFGVREVSAIAFFQTYQPDSALIVLPCLIIWMINTALPSALGAFSIINLKVNIV